MNAQYYLPVDSDEFQRILKERNEWAYWPLEWDERVLMAVEIKKKVYVGTILDASDDFAIGELHVWHPQPLGDAQTVCAAAAKHGKGVPGRLYKSLAPLYGDGDQNPQYFLTHNVARASNVKDPWPVCMEWDEKCTIISKNIRMKTGGKRGHMDPMQWQALVQYVTHHSKEGWDFYLLQGRGQK